jgi:UDP-galactopyranose mutase
MITVDYLVVGSGLTGATIARLLTDDNREVLVLERRAHLGGNVHDSPHSSNVRVHTYGPHYFRCSSPKIWEFVNRFSAFRPFQATVKSLVGGQYEEWPINRRRLDRHPGWQDHRQGRPPENFEEACLQKMPRLIYESFIEGYTRRQWGLHPRQLAPELAGRIRINDRHETALTPHCRYQGLPALGYARMMENMLAGIPCRLQVDFLKAQFDYLQLRPASLPGPEAHSPVFPPIGVVPALRPSQSSQCFGRRRDPDGGVEALGTAGGAGQGPGDRGHPGIPLFPRFAR